MNAGELSEKLTFGKYKGQTVADVLTQDPSYLVWAHENVDFFKVSQEIYELALTAKEEKDSEYEHDRSNNWDRYGYDPNDYYD